jgi:radical SAM protein with 4Fe4S-binding SPASM domain
MAGPGNKRVMDWLTCKRILSEAAEMGVEEVSFSGGEPLLWKNIVEAVQLSTSLNIRSFIYTTGIAPDAEIIMGRLKVAGLVRAMFSIFGDDAEGHESITATKGNYAKTLAAAKYLIDTGLETEFHFVPLAHTYKALPSIANIARAMGVKRVSVLRLVPQGRGSACKDAQLSNAQNLELRQMINDLRADGHDIRLGSPYNFLMLRKKPQCLSGIDRITISTDSKIYPCDAFKQISPEQLNVSSDFSDLSKNSLRVCWDNSPYLAVIRNYLMSDFADECSMCKKLNECLSGCLAQKFHTFGSLKKCADPMCVLNNSQS